MYWQVWCFIVDKSSRFSVETQVRGDRVLTILALFLREDYFLAGCAAIVDNSELELADTIKIWTALLVSAFSWKVKLLTAQLITNHPQSLERSGVREAKGVVNIRLTSLLAWNCW